MSPLLQMSGIKKRFGATLALAGVDLQVDAGEVLALVGENGAGKSTLMKVLSGAHAPDGGSMELAGQPYTPKNPLEARVCGVAMIYQELSLAPDLSVMENILLGVEPHRSGLLRRKEMCNTTREALRQVGLSHVAPETLVSRLSVAERQLVEIGRAIALKSRVLVFDEPTSSLTQADVARLFELIKKMKREGNAIIYISHFLEEVRELSDRFTVLRDGRSIGSGLTATTPNEVIIAQMVGRSVENLYPRSPRTPGKVVLKVDDLAGRSRPHSASIELRAGEVVGIAGLVGAGRTELLRSVFGLDEVIHGSIQLHQFSGSATPAERWKRGMGLISEDRKTEGLALNLSIAENLTLTQTPLFFNPNKRNRVASQWADKLFVKCDSVTQNIGDLSGGNQQKVAIARLLYHDCDVLLLDEPTRGIDVGSKAEIYRVIDNLALEGRAILLVSSYLPELLGTCDRIAVMCRGVLGPARPVEKVTEHSIMLEATGTMADTAENDLSEAA
jgi:ribose transport system ATP-binding protein